MRVLVTGGDGQLGRAIEMVFPKKETFFVTKSDFDITDREKTLYFINTIRPEVVIHTAAYTDVDGCERNKKLAQAVNVGGTKNIAFACQKIDANLVYISTDYVFDGKKKNPYTEADRPNPLSFYGKTKLYGEEIAKTSPKYLIIRTAWLFGEGKNFVKTILQIARQKSEIKVVADQIGSPTYALDLAKAIYKLVYGLRIMNQQSEIYHITNSGQCSWYQFACEIIKIKRLKTKIIPITTADWQVIKPDSAKRPLYSVLDCSKIKKLGIAMRPWQEALKDYLKIF